MATLYWLECGGTNCVFFEDEGTTWWPLPWILRNLEPVGVSSRPTSVFKTYQIGPEERRQFFTFSCSLLSFPKLSYFISEKALLRLLKQHHVRFLAKENLEASEDNFYNDSLRFLLQNPEERKSKAEVITEKISFSALQKLKIREQEKLKELTTLLLELTSMIQNSVTAGVLLDETTKQRCVELGKQIPKKLKRCFVLETPGFNLEKS